MLKKISFIFFILLFAAKLFSQACCAVGTSVSSGVERGVIPENNFSAALTYQHNILNDTYRGNENINDPLNRKSTVNDFYLELEYGLVEKVSVLLMGGYTNKSRTTTFFDSELKTNKEITFTGQGLTDIVILGKYELISPNILSPLSINIGGGAKLPTGSYERENNGTRLSIDLQPGTGATDLLLWAHAAYSFPSINLAFSLNSLYRYTGSNLDNYRFGDELLASLNSTYSVADFLGINLQWLARFSDKDFWNGRFLPSTGGTFIDLTPSVVYSEGSFNLRVFFQLPVYRNVDGIQLAVSEKLGAEVRYLFNLN
jgi:hypothetical protein